MGEMLHIEFRLRDGHTQNMPWTTGESAAIQRANSVIVAGQAESAVIRDDDGRVVWEWPKHDA